MAKNKRAFKPLKKKPGRKVRQKRRQYKLWLKNKVIHWKTVDNLTPKQIRNKVKAEVGYEIAPSTLSTWWSPATLANISEVGPDRTNANDTRLSSKQRPAILIDMEHILARKVRAILLTGVPYTRQVIQILAIHIFHKLASYKLYDHNGHRKNPGERISAEVIDSVEHSTIVSRYMCKSNKKTEFHKSMETKRNATRANIECKLCPRKFKGEVNMTLHVYWHTIQEQGGLENPLDISADEDDEDQFKVSASAGWVYNFLNRHDLRKLKMKGEKGSADFDAVAPWVKEWLTFIHTQYVQKHHKTLQQVITIIVNFDECGFQFKSIPQYSSG